MPLTRYFQVLTAALCFSASAFAGELDDAGLLFSRFKLTLDIGDRTEVLGPLFYSEQKDSLHTWAFPPLTLAHVEDPTIEYKEFDFAYPLLTYDRFGSEYRWQFFQLWSFAGGGNPDESKDRRFTLFPIYFQQRSTDPTHNYTAVFPIYGHLKDRLFRSEIDFVLFPIYSRTRKRDVVTKNMPYPFVHVRTGDGLKGWQVWPFVGHEHKDVTSKTNGFGDVESIPGHDRRFILWPFYFQTFSEIGTTNQTHQQTLLPFYSFTRSPARDSTSYGWPLGYTHTTDREKQYTEWAAPWPLIVFDRGPGKTTSRVWPLFSQSHNDTLESDWYLWPVYKYNRFRSEPLERERSRILFFLYSDVREKNSETGKTMRRVDFWPLFTHRRGFDGHERLQILSVIEPVLPNNKSIERTYSHVYSLWRSEKNAKTGASSQSLLWNLYRHEAGPGTKKCSLLFGLFKYESTPEGRRWRVCYIPVGKAKALREPSAQR